MAYRCRTHVSVWTLVGHLSVKCSIQKIFVGFFKNSNLNKEQILLNLWFQKNLKHTFTHKYFFFYLYNLKLYNIYLCPVFYVLEIIHISPYHKCAPIFMDIIRLFSVLTIYIYIYAVIGGGG